VSPLGPTFWEMGDGHETDDGGSSPIGEIDETGTTTETDDAPGPERHGSPGHRVSVAWAPFGEALVGVLAALAEDEFLVLSSKRRAHVVQFAAGGATGLRAETLSNAFLPPADQLDEARESALADLGWQRPTHTPEQADLGEGDPDGSPNWYRDWPAPPPFAEVAELAVRTWRDVLGAVHPGRLHYRAFRVDGQRILLPTLGINPEPDDHPVGDSSPGGDLGARVRAVLKAFLEVDELVVDDDGDIPIRHGSAAVYVRVIDEPPTIMLFSPLVFGIEAGEAVLEEVNRLNNVTQFAHLCLAADAIVLSTELFGEPFVPDHLIDAYVVVSQLADELDDHLQEQFGGKVFFGEDKPATPPKPPLAGTGGYL